MPLRRLEDEFVLWREGVRIYHEPPANVVSETECEATMKEYIVTVLGNYTSSYTWRHRSRDSAIKTATEITTDSALETIISEVVLFIKPSVTITSPHDAESPDQPQSETD